jgi:hypothetical protein
MHLPRHETPSFPGQQYQSITGKMTHFYCVFDCSFGFDELSLNNGVGLFHLLEFGIVRLMQQVISNFQKGLGVPNKESTKSKPEIRNRE